MEVKPFADRNDSRKDQVRDMFDRIAEKYDFLNHLLSFNTDKKWRRKLVRMVKELANETGNKEISILDVATGTGDLAFALNSVEGSIVTGLDLSEQMLSEARKKDDKVKAGISWQVGDSESLPFETSVFDFVTVAFGVRNYENLEKGLSEMTRVLKKGGHLLILEFSKPPKGLFGFLYRFYSKRILPLLASVFTSEPRAYTYLPDSIEAFPSGDEMINLLKKTGLTECKHELLTGGIATIYTGRA